MHEFSQKDAVRQAALTTGVLQAHTHFGGEYYRDAQGRVQPKYLNYGQPLPDYGYFLSLMKEIGYNGYICFELCHPIVNEAHEPQGIAYVDEQVQLAREFMNSLIKENLP